MRKKFVGWEIPEIGFTFAFAAKIWPVISPELTELSISNLQNLQRPVMSIGISFEIGGFPSNLAPRGGQSYRQASTVGPLADKFTHIHRSHEMRLVDPWTR